MNQTSKQIAALAAAFLITGCLGLGMLIMGASAMLNTNSTTAANAPQAAAANPAINPAASQPAQEAQVAQLQALVAQYQQREQQLQQREQQYQQHEQQYRDQLLTAQQELTQASNQLQQYQQVFDVLQSRGVLRFNSSEGGEDD